MFTTPNLLTMLWASSLDSLYMVSISIAVTILLGIPLGVVLVVTRPGHIMETVWLNKILGFVVNFTRSIPFLIFMVFIGPITKKMVGTSIGPTAVIVPLSLAAAMLMSRMAETSLLEVPTGLIEAAQAYGASKRQIIWHVLLPEARSGLILSATTLIITLIGFSAMAGAIGGGGLGDLAIRYGYQRYMPDVMWVCVLLLYVVVQAIQYTGEFLAKKFSRR
ncbi:MAG: ABC transporter permease [Candidatus Adiutrix sp.]|jgi:D-methionine transport system permease protein|nr:ABC transporter permease [Candidatus Adiutrix sp.]